MILQLEFSDFGFSAVDVADLASLCEAEPRESSSYTTGRYVTKFGSCFFDSMTPICETPFVPRCCCFGVSFRPIQ